MARSRQLGRLLCNLLCNLLSSLIRQQRWASKSAHMVVGEGRQQMKRAFWRFRKFRSCAAKRDRKRVQQSSESVVNDELSTFALCARCLSDEAGLGRHHVVLPL